MKAQKCTTALSIMIGLFLVAAYASAPEPLVPESSTNPRRTTAVPLVEVVEGSIKPNATLVATLVDLEVPSDIAQSVARLIQPVFDVRNFRSGNSFKLAKDTEGNLHAFEYKIDREKILEVARDADTYAARVSTLDLTAEDITILAEISPKTNSLYAALLEQNSDAVELAEKIASIFAWDVDFNSDLQVNDRIRIRVPSLSYEGKFVKWGDVQAAELVNSGKTYRAYRFQNAYYDAKGNALKREWLASPLPFTRVTSGFSRRRLHPILGTRRPHLAVDYGAPTGTPVQAVANGTIISAGWDSGYGNLVRIKHSGGLTTGYAHLSRIAAGVRAGRAVQQGDLIGNVGATGLATGPHLHYMMTKGGQPINPMSIKSEPPIPIDAKLRPQFLATIAPLEAVFDPVRTAAK
jgi:murein DD-endopeptidase MepM/ murein hydrolase activator NlpD